MQYKFWQRVVSCFVLAGVLLSLVAPTGMAQAAPLGQTEPPPVTEERQEQAPPASETPGQPERSESFETGLVNGITAINASTVNSVSPGQLPAGMAVDVCFNVTVSSPDLEYLYRFDVDLPDTWTVNSVADVTGTGCGSGHTRGTGAGNVIYWQTVG